MIYHYKNLYADDTTLYDIQSNKAQIENNLQHVLNLLHTWCLENGMLLNTDKTKLMLITNRHRSNTFAGNDLTLYNDVELHITCCEKYLGVHFDNTLEWTDHFQHVCKKISSNLWLFSQIKSYLSQQHRVLYYNACIKSHFEYCCTIWGNYIKWKNYKDQPAK